MFVYLHLFQEAPVSIDGVYYEDIPTEALHQAERGEIRGIEGNGKKRSEVEERV
jgi:hypothetical protein